MKRTQRVWRQRLVLCMLPRPWPRPGPRRAEAVPSSRLVQCARQKSSVGCNLGAGGPDSVRTRMQKKEFGTLICARARVHSSTGLDLPELPVLWQVSFINNVECIVKALHTCRDQPRQDRCAMCNVRGRLVCGLVLCGDGQLA